MSKEDRRRFNAARSFDDEDDDTFFPGPASTAPPPPPPPQHQLNPAAATFVPSPVPRHLIIRGLAEPIDVYLFRSNMAVLRLPQPSYVSCWRESVGTWVVVALYSRHEHMQLVTAALRSGWPSAWMHLSAYWGLG